jgi:sorting nexin-1/2
MLASIKTAMTQRTDKKNAYINALTDLEAKQSAYKKLQSQPGKESQLPAKEVAIQASQEASDAAKADFERVSDRLLSEFEVFKNQKATDIKEIVLNFVNLQVNFNQSIKYNP